MKNKIYLTIILALSTAALTNAQAETKKIQLDALMKVTADPNANYNLVLTKVASENFEGIIYDYSNQIKAKGRYVQNGKKYLEDGHFTFYFMNGQIESEGEYDRGVKVGYWKRFDQNGKRKSDRYYPAESADLIREAMMMEKDDDN